ncbi:MAG: GNAT family N-acetyltransferase [Bacteroidia bacterium]|nr:GNAT family N-acetyltransferase [Bacteroidia bacterium]
MAYSLRRATPADIPDITALFGASIRTLCVRDYSLAQVDAWAARGQDHDRWLERIRQQYFLLAEGGGSLAGMASLRPDGYLDMMYVSPAHVRRGVGFLLLSQLMEEARIQGHGLLTSDVSRTARPFFERQGFRVVRAQEVSLGEVLLTNYHMWCPI